MKNNLDLGSFILQLMSLEILFKDCTNNSILNELQNQDRNYLEKIIKQNEEILSLLKGDTINGKRTARKSN